MRGKLASLGTKVMPHGRGVGLAMGGIFAAGLVGNSARSFLDLGNEAAFGDENADRYFLGERGLSPGTVLDSTFGSGMAAGGTIAGGALGAAGGAAAGIGASKMLKEAKFANDINIPKKFADDIPLIGGKNVPLGGKTLFKGGVTTKARGLGLIGAAVGGAVGASAFVSSHINRNREFFQSNPYSRGSAMQASSTGAYGDIVLGMHNTRRG
jgi:hypothetical protein